MTDKPKRHKVGEHLYYVEGTSDCAYGCGAWMGPYRSRAPDGIDPFGACPKAPKETELEPMTPDQLQLVKMHLINLPEDSWLRVCVREIERCWQSLEDLGGDLYASEVSNKELEKENERLKRLLDELAWNESRGPSPAERKITELREENERCWQEKIELVSKLNAQRKIFSESSTDRERTLEEENERLKAELAKK